MDGLEKLLDDKSLELKEIAINYEQQILEIRQNFEDSLENFKNNFKIQSGATLEKPENCDAEGANNSEKEMRDELMEDFKEFEDTQADLEEYMSNGVINEENTCQDSVEIMSNSFELEQVSDNASIELSNR